MSERMPKIVASTIVAMSRNFVALLLLRKASPPPPKTGDKPVPGACSKIAVTRRIETIICKMVNTISPIIYHFAIIMQRGICLPELTK